MNRVSISIFSILITTVMMKVPSQVSQSLISQEPQLLHPCSDDYCYGQLSQRMSQLEQIVRRQSLLISSLQQTVSQQAQTISTLTGSTTTGVTLQAVLDHIKNNGLRLGNRWIIKQEGTGSYEALVFRDYPSSAAGFD